MGLSIHYSGSLSDPAILPDMISEVSDIAKTFGWRCEIFDSEFPEQGFDSSGFNMETVYGLCVIPPGSEPVWLCFLSNGRMSTPLLLQHWSSETDEERKKFLYMPWTKTQYAGIEEHIKVVTLFRYLEKKYLSVFHMTDEGGYWETNDLNVLKESFRKYNYIMDAFADLLENSDSIKGESLEDFVKRIAGLVDKKFREEMGDETPDSE
ncbi:MAG: hypothetical protein FD170_1662 [Bacteroidetes bacterium]|nr:MAG: hypothetical protein FD170_1662 [Bacteroidota bacterium]